MRSRGKLMNVIDIEKKCVGCGACVDVCPKNVLSLKPNADGFYEPRIVGETCIDCNQCVRVCPAIEPFKGARDSDYYYGWANDERIRAQSTSGGAFSTLANEILKSGGVVFGAKYSEDRKAVEMASTEECDLDALRKSKYCQARSCGLYKKMAQELQAGKKVMLTGTPCQITAARKYFGENENLLLVAFICGGVIPDKVLREHVEWLEKKYKSEVEYINIRDKSKGWSTMRIQVGFKNGKVYQRYYKFDYYYYYYTPNLKNEQCMTCSFTNHDAVDISIADFWGFRKEKIQNDDKGMSLICAHTEKGKAIVAQIKDKMILHPLKEEQAQYAFREKQHTAAAIRKRAEFLRQVRETSFIRAARKNFFKGGMAVVFIKTVIGKILRRK